ncbi:translational elongation factor EF-1 alpha [Entomophthora muscae]|nr:translational elongation factor EF-1 alpha [Entomophthora muscae]
MPSLSQELANLKLTAGPSVAESLKALSTVKSSADLQKAADSIAQVVKDNGIGAFAADDLLEKLSKNIVSKASPEIREGAILTYAALHAALGRSADPFIFAGLPGVLEALSDKAGSVRQAADAFLKNYISTISPYSVKALLPILFQALELNAKWQTKEGALNLIASLADPAPIQVQNNLKDIVPIVSDAMWDSKPQVKTAAKACMTKVTKCVGNGDIDPFLPYLIDCIANPSLVPETIYKLGSTTFVRAVEAPTLSIMVPLLVRGLNERPTNVKRQTSVIIDNMCKLVDNVADAEQFLPKLLPGLEKAIEVVSDPECITIVKRAHATLYRVGAGGNKTVSATAALEKRSEMIRTTLKSLISQAIGFPVEDNYMVKTAVEFVSVLSLQAVDIQSFDFNDWSSEFFTPCLTWVLNDQTESICQSFLKLCIAEHERVLKEAAPVEEEDDGEVLCDCSFSLAYGALILLNNTNFKLYKARRYGLCGPNGAGKSTLMRAIANGQLDGFPSPDELKTVFVEHALQGDDSDMTPVTYLCDNGAYAESEVVELLSSVGFTQDMMSNPITSLSGGWKMKAELARAMLCKPDILMLDEPTNHLDTTNVAWLENYLISLPEVTCIIVSHDSGFLENVCTGFIHYENRKLKIYKGNLSEFVRKVPEAKTYYDLSASQLKFSFPTPGYLEGIKSKDKAIIKMTNVDFTYPNTTRQIVHDIYLQCSLSSRVVVHGRNGAGKSTIIKILTGEMLPTNGDVWKHPMLRVAYVAQHAFHHLERHLDKTPNQYIQWRYQYGEDRELLEKETRQMSDEDRVQMEKVIVYEGNKLQIENLFGRRKLKKSYEYEVKWVGKPYDENTWIPRDQLEQWGFSKIVQTFDDKEAARAGLYARPLTSANIQKHLEDVGLEAEFATHSRIRGLSGGQKVKVVLAAAMWDHPHLLVMDEPTNYLDRDSLGALANAMACFEGGVIMITHNTEFVKLCPEKWHVENGTMTIEGGKQFVREKIEHKVVETVKDAFGNVVKVKQPKKELSRKEKKALEKKRKAALANGETISEDEDDFDI